MASSMIRKLYNSGTSLASSAIEAGKDSIAPALTGLAIGAAGTKMKLDAGPVPVEVVMGVGLRALDRFGARKYLPAFAKNILTHPVLADVSSAAVGAGMARVGAKLATGSHGMPAHHGELGIYNSMSVAGSDSYLSAAAAKL